MRRLVLFFVALGVFGQAVSITGTVKNPDGTAVNGTIRVQLSKPTVTNACTTPAQVISFQPVVVKITNGTLDTLSLYPSACLVPSLTTPISVVPGKAAGTGATTIHGLGPDLNNDIVLHTGSNTTAGVVATMLWGQKYYTAPICVISSNGLYYGMGYKTTVNSISLVAEKALRNGFTYTVYFWCGTDPYSMSLSDAKNQMLYQSKWIVPQGGGDVSVLDVK